MEMFYGGAMITSRERGLNKLLAADGLDVPIAFDGNVHL
jgi:hypothetical protein